MLSLKERMVRAVLQFLSALLSVLTPPRVVLQKIPVRKTLRK